MFNGKPTCYFWWIWREVVDMTLLGWLTNPPDVDDVTAFWFSKIVPYVNETTNMAVLFGILVSTTLLLYSNILISLWNSFIDLRGGHYTVSGTFYSNVHYLCLIVQSLSFFLLSVEGNTLCDLQKQCCSRCVIKGNSCKEHFNNNIFFTNDLRMLQATH